MEKFKHLGLNNQLLKAIEDAKFSEPTEIQEKAIPLALAGKDIIGESATGSGKTLAFGASIIEKSMKGKGIQTLIITPTRELAEQIGKSLRLFSKYKPLSVAMVYGGVAISPQIQQLRQAEIVVGTPGRILDHLQQGTLVLKNIRTLVLDEADRMLDMGFIDDVNKIISQCPAERQTFLFSATITPDISVIARKYLKNPVQVSVENYVDPSKLGQVYYDVPQNIKFSLLVHLLKGEHSGLVMVFCNTRHNTDFIARNLQHNDINAMATHGGLTQARRNKIMEHFHKGSVFVLVCTDVAARGLDIKGVSHIYNYDIPGNSKDYIHRIGRTARAGKEGKAVSIVSPRDYANFRFVLKDPELQIKQEPLPQIMPLRVSMFDQHRSERGRFSSNRGAYGDRGSHRGQSSFGHRRPFGNRGRSQDHSGERRSYGRSGESRSRGSSYRGSSRGYARPRRY